MGFSMCCKKVSSCLFSCCRHDVIYSTAPHVGLEKTRKQHTYMNASTHTHTQSHARMQCRKTTETCNSGSDCQLLCRIGTNAHTHTLCSQSVDLVWLHTGCNKDPGIFYPADDNITCKQFALIHMNTASKWLMNMGTILLRRHVCVSIVCVWMKYHIVIFQSFPCTRRSFFLFFFFDFPRGAQVGRRCRWREERE